MVRLKIISILFLFISSLSLSHAQERAILRPNGEKISLDKSKNLKEAIKVSKLKTFQGEQTKHSFPQLDFSAIGKADTLNYTDYGSFNTNFGFWAQDVMVQWFVASADMTIKAAGFSCSDDEGAINGATVSIRLLRLNWTEEQLKDFSSAAYQGYYPSDGDGFNNSDYFGEEATGNWISKDINNPLPPWTNNPDPNSNSWDYDLWQEVGFGWPIVPEKQEGPGNYQWVEMMDSGYEPEVKAGDIFGVVVMHNGITLDEDRIGFYADDFIGYPGWKYYENGRLSPEEPGWWVRKYTWDFAVAVDITGDEPPRITNVTKLPTSLTEEPRRVEANIVDYNPSGGQSGVVSANLRYTIDYGDTQIVPMTYIGNDLYEAYIPGHDPCTTTTYWIEAEDINGNKSKSISYTYKVWCFNNNDNLVVFNGFQEASGFPQSYYFGFDDTVHYIPFEWEYDTWAYGPLTEELVNNYNNIFEITTSGPDHYNNNVIREWLNKSGEHNYFLAGQEWFYLDWPVPPFEYPPGSFEYDILGITKTHWDISYENPGDQYLPSKVRAIEGTLLGNCLYEFFNQQPTDSLQYDPYSVINAPNWLDGFNVREDVEVFMKAESRADSSVEYNIGASRVLDAGNRIVFLAYDPLSLNSSPDNYWYGFSVSAPQVQTIVWFPTNYDGCIQPQLPYCPVIVSINEDEKITSYYINQNYPNPFNPSTIIKYQVPERSFVTLKVYDILGNEIITLVNEEKEIGEYKVEFGNKNLSSGVYFYSFRAGNYIDAKKMILLR